MHSEQLNRQQTSADNSENISFATIILPRMANASARLDTLRKLVELDAEYLNSYRPFYHCFLQPLQKAPQQYGIDPTDLSTLVNYMVGIVGLTKKVGLQLRERCTAWEELRGASSEVSLTDIFERDGAKYAVYGKYILGFDRMMQWYAVMLGRSSNGRRRRASSPFPTPPLQELWDRCDQHPQLGRIGVAGHFILPMRYMLRLRELWSQMLSLMPRTHPNRESVANIVSRLDSIAQPLLASSQNTDCDSPNVAATMRQTLHMLAIQEALTIGSGGGGIGGSGDGGKNHHLVILRPGRQLISGGSLYLVQRGPLSCTTSLINLYLFTDMLLLVEDPQLDHSGHRRFLFGSRRNDPSTPFSVLVSLGTIPLSKCWYYDPCGSDNVSKQESPGENESYRESVFQVIQLDQNPVLNEHCDAFKSGVNVYTFIATSRQEKEQWRQQFSAAMNRLISDSPAAVRERQLIIADWRPFFNKGVTAVRSWPTANSAATAVTIAKGDENQQKHTPQYQAIMAGRVGGVFKRLFQRQRRRHSTAATTASTLRMRISSGSGGSGSGGSSINALSMIFSKPLQASQWEL